jgi:hypothetical protein
MAVQYRGRAVRYRATARSDSGAGVQQDRPTVAGWGLAALDRIQPGYKMSNTIPVPSSLNEILGLQFVP